MSIFAKNEEFQILHYLGPILVVRESCTFDEKGIKVTCLKINLLQCVLGQLNEKVGCDTFSIFLFISL